MEIDIRYVRSAIEDPAFKSRSSEGNTRGRPIWGHPIIIFLRNQFGDIGNPKMVGDVVLSTTLLKHWGCGQSREQKLEWKRLVVNERSSEPPRKAMREWR